MLEVQRCANQLGFCVCILRMGTRRPESRLSMRNYGEDACLFVFVGVRSGGGAIASSSGTVGGGGRGDGNLLLVIDETVVWQKHCAEMQS